MEVVDSFKKVVDITDQIRDEGTTHKLVEPYLNNIEINEFLLEKKRKKFSHFTKKPKSLGLYGGTLAS